MVLLAMPLMMLSCSPAVAPSAAPTVSDVDAAREVYGRLNAARGVPRPRRVGATWEEVAAVAVLAGRTAGLDRVAFRRSGHRGELMASLPVPGGLWLNGRAYLGADAAQRLRVSGRLGLLPVPSPVVHLAIDVARRLLRARGADIPPLAQMVSEVSLGDDELSAMLRLPGRSRMFSTLSGMRSDRIDVQRVALYYCRLVADHDADPQADFAVQVRRAFGNSSGSVLDNRAAFVALAMLVAGTDVGLLAAEREPLMAGCGHPQEAGFELLGREDLVKHWAVSAALASAFGSQASLSVGTWKEISDSGVGGSGFSLVDLAADRSGVFCAEKGGQPEQSRAVRDWLARATQQDLLPVSALALAEGMSEEAFRHRYTSVDDDAFTQAMAHIDATLAVLIHF